MSLLKRCTSCVLGLALLAIAGCSSPGDKRSQEAEQNALRLEATRHQALRSGNAAPLDSILADDFVEIGAGGADRTKAQNVADVGSGALRWKTIDFLDEHAHAFSPEAVVVTGRVQGEGTFQGDSIMRRARYLHVYLKRDGRWQNVAAMSTPVSP